MDRIDEYLTRSDDFYDIYEDEDDAVLAAALHCDVADLPTTAGTIQIDKTYTYYEVVIGNGEILMRDADNHEVLSDGFEVLDHLIAEAARLEQRLKKVKRLIEAIDPKLAEE